MNKSNLVKNVFDWEHFLIYLSGPIDFDREGGKNWRDEWVERMAEAGMKREQIINPCRKPLGASQFNLDNESEIMEKHRVNKEWGDLCKVMSHITHIDLRFVDKSDIILVNMPKVGQHYFASLTKKFSDAINHLRGLASLPAGANTKHLNAIEDSYLALLAQTADQRVPTYGTLHEMVVAHQQRKPIFMVWEGGKESCSAWLMWMIGHSHVFSTFDELLTRLVNISKGKTAYNAKEWLLLDLSGEEEEKQVDPDGGSNKV